MNDALMGWLERALAAWEGPGNPGAFVDWLEAGEDAPREPDSFSYAEARGEYFPFFMDWKSIPAFLLDDADELRLTREDVDAACREVARCGVDELLEEWASRVADLTDGRNEKPVEAGVVRREALCQVLHERGCGDRQLADEVVEWATREDAPRRCRPGERGTLEKAGYDDREER